MVIKFFLHRIFYNLKCIYYFFSFTVLCNYMILPKSIKNIYNKVFLSITLYIVLKVLEFNNLTAMRSIYGTKNFSLS